jgi:1-acyl-sn-glycerol-3-phosphate acyltransferase
MENTTLPPVLSEAEAKAENADRISPIILRCCVLEEENNGAVPLSDTAAEPRCQAITREGQQCRNRPLEGQSFCRLHASAETSVGADEVPIAGAQPVPADDRAAELADVAAAVQELEVEIRNHQAAQAGAQDFAAGALRLIRENLLRLPAEATQRMAALVRENLSSDYLDPDFWRGVGMVLQYQVNELSAMVQRRMRGEFTLDDYGMDAELVDLVRPLSGFLYRTYWRVRVTGLEHVPDEGRALLVANHGGVLPWDAVMVASAVLEDHPNPRVVRTLYPGAFKAIPGVARALATFGQVVDTGENATRLLEEDQLALVFPEGVEGLGKLFWNRGKLGRFRRNGSVAMAIRTGAPIVPVAVVGAEEAQPMLADLKPLAEALRLPFFPITPLFPWLGPLGLIPLPSKWSIAFSEPIPTSELGPGAADDPQLVGRLCEDVRARIQALMDEQLAARPAAFS